MFINQCNFDEVYSLWPVISISLIDEGPGVCHGIRRAYDHVQVFLDLGCSHQFWRVRLSSWITMSDYTLRGLFAPVEIHGA